MILIIKWWQRTKGAPPITEEVRNVTYRNLHEIVAAKIRKAQEDGFVHVKRFDGGAVIPFSNLSTCTYKIFETEDEE